MGVPGLNSLLKENQIFENIHFRDSKLVVDGNNLVYTLYFTSKLDQNHGGEYLAFQAQVRDFFTNLDVCGVKPYVLMDGGSGDSVDRVETVMARTRKKFWRAHEAAVTGRSMGILPIHTWLLFEQTLSDMKVPQAKCFGEADRQVAALAREWCCPVLSNDNDFYIFDLPEGFLLLDHFRWDVMEADDGENYIPCQRYTTSLFCNFFHIDANLLPVFASLARNNSVQKTGGGSEEMAWRGMEMPWRGREMPWRGREMPWRGREMPWRAYLVGLLSWLQGFQMTEDTLTAAMENVPERNRHEVQTKVREVMLEYHIPGSSLLGFFNEGITPPLPEGILNRVPAWVGQLLVSGGLGVSILLQNTKILYTQVEDSTLESSSLTSRPIRQVLYGLLLGQGVTESVRDGLELTSIMVQPVVPEATMNVTLESLPQTDRAVRLRVFLETMGVEEEWLMGVPDELLLPVAVTCYWLRWASPEPNLKHLEALLMVMVQGELKRRKGLTGGLQGDTDQIPHPPDSGVAHSFNQWQACLRDASLLNQLLCTPLPQHHMAWLYQGRLVHQRVKQLQQPEQLQWKVHSANFRRMYNIVLGATQFVRQ